MTDKDINNIEVIDPQIITFNNKNMTITQKSKENTWTDENGTPIPYNRTTKSERLMERYSASILKKAQAINKNLIAYKEYIRKLSQEAYDTFMLEKEVSKNKKHKGNFTWFNFNRTIKIEVSVNEPITFDELTITAAKLKFDEFLETNITASNEFVKAMILDAFQTSRGHKMDVIRVMNLTRYKSKINKPLFTEAVTLIEEAIRRPKSKTYFRVWLKDEEGKYQNVDLNLSSV